MWFTLKVVNLLFTNQKIKKKRSKQFVTTFEADVAWFNK